MQIARSCARPYLTGCDVVAVVAQAAHLIAAVRAVVSADTGFAAFGKMVGEAVVIPQAVGVHHTDASVSGMIAAQAFILQRFAKARAGFVLWLGLWFRLGNRCGLRI